MILNHLPRLYPNMLPLHLTTYYYVSAEYSNLK